MYCRISHGSAAARGMSRRYAHAAWGGHREMYTSAGVEVTSGALLSCHPEPETCQLPAAGRQERTPSGPHQALSRMVYPVHTPYSHTACSMCTQFTPASRHSSGDGRSRHAEVHAHVGESVEEGTGVGDMGRARRCFPLGTGTLCADPVPAPLPPHRIRARWHRQQRVPARVPATYGTQAPVS